MSEGVSRFVDSTDLLSDPAGLRDRAGRDGCLFFRGLLPREEVMRVRAEELAVVERHGWRQPGQDPLGDRIDIEAINRVPDPAMRTDIGVSISAYHDVQKLESMHRLPHHPRLVNLYRTLFGREVLVHPRHIARMISPHRSVFPTPQHQDFPLIQGTQNTWTAWFPLGDCPRDMGSLSVCRGSHRVGYIPVLPASGAGGLAAQLCPGEADWVEGDFSAGDVLTFTSLTVHRALKGQYADRMRLSLDVRYQAVDEVVDESSLRPHCDLTWEQIYTGWKSPELQYYWKKLPLRMGTWDAALLQPKTRIC